MGRRLFKLLDFNWNSLAGAEEGTRQPMLRISLKKSNYSAYQDVMVMFW